MKFVSLSSERAAELFRGNLTRLRHHTDRMFTWLMVFQWIGGLVAAYCLSPQTWAGAESHVHPHVWAALFLGGAVTLLPILMIRAFPGRALTRHVISICQMLMSALLICVTGGRIETHFHIFGSLAFLAFYRDWPILVSATVVTAVDHILRGTFWPQTVFGVAVAGPWRWVEHAGWVVFEDIFLLLATAQSLREMKSVAERQAQLEEAETSLRDAHDGLERQVEARTAELSFTNQSLQEQMLEREKAEETVRWQAYHDSLTGLPNRVLFHDRLEQAVAYARRHEHQIAVLFVDLDRFKQVNDTLGHTAGDQLLIEMANRLGLALGEGCTVARMGGDEFTALLPSISQAEDAVRAAERLLAALLQPMRLEDQDIHLSASIGIAIFPADGDDADSLLRHADAAMYRCKEQGGGYQFYAEEMDAVTRERLSLESSLRRALTQQEMILYYQPQVDLASGRIRGVEALVRWRHPELGLVPPTKFIPLAEETGLIVPLGKWVLWEAAQQAALWREAGYDIQMSVNVSARQFEQPDWTPVVAAILEKTDLPPGALELELTESTIMARGAAVVQSLQSLKDLGVRLAVDDFGTGYSSLSYLRRFPLDLLKVDRSFVRGLDTDEVDVAIVRAVVDLAHAVGLEVVAEGVETHPQWTILESLGCDTIQGYLFSPPVPAREMERLLSKNRDAVESRRETQVRMEIQRPQYRAA